MLAQCQRLLRYHVPRLIGAREHNGGLLIVQELLAGDLLRARGRLLEEALRCLACQLLYVQDKLGANGIVHRDFKPENILLDARGNAKVADFGIAVQVDSARLAYNAIGTPGYMAPEAEQASATVGYGPDVDRYSIGVLLNELRNANIPISRVGQAVLHRLMDPIDRPGLFDPVVQRWFQPSSVFMTEYEQERLPPCGPMYPGVEPPQQLVAYAQYLIEVRDGL